MTSELVTPDDYVASLPEERKVCISQLRRVILDNLPEGFMEVISYGMIGYVVPHSIYPNGYHCDPKLPLPFLSIASQKNFVALYHMGLYSDQEQLHWFTSEYLKHSKAKLDMGKSCIRFKRIDQIPFNLNGELVAKMSPERWIEIYEKVLKR